MINTEDEQQKKERGLLIVISGPSCAGKGTVCKIVLKHHPEIKISISETTRSPREDEVNGVHYFFVKQDEFEKGIETNRYLEYAKVYKNYYGTPKEYVENFLDSGYDVILEIDIQGAANVRKNHKEGVYIFIAPPSLESLRERIIKRGSESEEQMDIRLDCAAKELANAEDYSYVVINEDKDVAASQVEAIIMAEKCRSERQQNTIKQIIGR